MSHLNRKWAIIFLGLGLVLGLAAGASAQDQSRPNGDIVFIIDESGSMFNDATVIQRNLQAIVDTLQGRINFHLGLVGFGAFKGHSDTAYEGEPHVHLELTEDVAAFRRALDGFVTVGQLEPGFSALELAANTDLGYRPDAGTCAVFISDEGPDVYEEAPTTKAEALQALQRRGASLIGIVNWGATVDPGFDVDERGYGPKPGGLIPEAGGKSFNVVEFRNNPTPVLRAVMEDCITAIETGSLQDSTQPELPGGSAETPETNLMLEQLRQQVEINTSQLFELRNQMGTWTRELSSLRTTVSQLAERMPDQQITVQIESIRTSIREITARVDRLQRQLQSGPDGGAMQSKLNELQGQLQGILGLTERVAQLERAVSSLEDQSITVEIRSQFESLRQDVETSLDVVDQRLAGISDTVATLGNTQQDQAARLDELNARLSEVQAQLDGLPIGALQDRLSTLEGRTSAVEDQVERLQARQQQIEGDLGSLPNEVVQLRTSLGELDQRLTQGLSELTNRVSTNEAAMSELEQRVQQVQAIGEKFNENFANVMARLDELRAELDQLKQSGTVTPEELQALADRVGSNEDALNRLGDDLAALQERMGELSDAFEASNASVSDRLNALANRQNQAETQLGQLQDALGNLEGIRAQLGQLRQRFDELEPQVQSSADAISSLGSRVGQLESQVEGQMGDLQGQLDGLSQRLDEQGQAIDDLRGRLDGLQSDVQQSVIEELQQEGGVVRVEVQEDLLTRRLAQIALAFSLAAIGVAWFLFMNR